MYFLEQMQFNLYNRMHIHQQIILDKRITISLKIMKKERNIEDYITHAIKALIKS